MIAHVLPLRAARSLTRRWLVIDSSPDGVAHSVGGRNVAHLGYDDACGDRARQFAAAPEMEASLVELAACAARGELPPAETLGRARAALAKAMGAEVPAGA